MAVQERLPKPLLRQSLLLRHKLRQRLNRKRLNLKPLRRNNRHNISSMKSSAFPAMKVDAQKASACAHHRWCAVLRAKTMLTWIAFRAPAWAVASASRTFRILFRNTAQAARRKLLLHSKRLVLCRCHSNKRLHNPRLVPPQRRVRKHPQSRCRANSCR